MLKSTFALSSSTSTENLETPDAQPNSPLPPVMGFASPEHVPDVYTGRRGGKGLRQPCDETKQNKNVPLPFTTTYEELIGHSNIRGLTFVVPEREHGIAIYENRRLQ